jgi:hypothetical protein
LFAATDSTFRSYVQIGQVNLICNIKDCRIHFGRILFLETKDWKTSSVGKLKTGKQVVCPSHQAEMICLTHLQKQTKVIMPKKGR